MNENKDFLKTEPVGRLLLKLAVPTVTAQIINMLYNIVDRIYIGHIPEIGDKALTGVGVCMPLIMIVTAFAGFVGYGGAPRASIFMGKGDYKSSEKILGNCFVVQIIISVLLTAALLLWNRDFLMAFGASENTIEYGVAYMNVYAMGTIFVQMTLGMNAFITAQGFAKTGMLSVLIGAVANIILDPVFIFGFEMGVEGAAWATIISQAMSCAWVLLFLCGKKTNLKLQVKNMGLNAKIIFPCMTLGLSTFIMQASESVISICFNSSLLKYGGDIAVGAMTILTSVMQFAMLPLQGLGQGAQPIISYNYGAQNAERVKAAFKLLLKASLVYSTLLWVFVMIFSPGICGNVHEFSGTSGVYEKRPENLYGMSASVRNSDCLPDDIYGIGECKGFYHSSCYEEVYFTYSADLYNAAYIYRRSNNGRISGGAGSGLSCGFLYNGSVYRSV